MAYLEFIWSVTVLLFNPPMAKGGMPPPTTGFSNFSREWKELFEQIKFLAVGSSFGASVHE